MSSEIDTDHIADIPEPGALPAGYGWRLVLTMLLFFGAAFCFLFLNFLVGTLLSVAGMAFAKFSGLNDMLAHHARTYE